MVLRVADDDAELPVAENAMHLVEFDTQPGREVVKLWAHDLKPNGEWWLNTR